MIECGDFSKTICAICCEDLKPIVEDLQVISICGHVFHEFCVQQWFECCSKVQKITCPVCKQRCSHENACRLYFQSISDPILSQKPFRVEAKENDLRELRREVKKLQRKLSGLASSEQDLKELNEELCDCKEKVKKEEGLKNEALKQNVLIQQLLNSKSEELLRLSTECSRLQERNTALAKELVAFKLVSDLNLEEEDVSKLASSDHELNRKDTIYVLKKSLLLRNRSYKELLAQCNLLEKRGSRYLKKLEKAKAKIKKIKSRVQELEIALEQKDNEVLRSLKASNTTPGKVWNSSSSFICKCSSEELMEQPVELVNSNCSVSLTNDPCHSQKTENSKSHKDLCENTFNKEASTTNIDQGRYSLHKLRSPNFKPQKSSSFSGSLRSSLSSVNTACDTKEEVWGHGQSSRVGLSALSNDTKKDMDNAPASVMKDDVVVLSDDEITEVPLLNTRKETPYSASISHPGNRCFSGGLLGPDGTNRYLGKWCKRGQSKEPTSSSVMQGSGISGRNLIDVEADERDDKVLRSQKESSLDSKGSSL